MRRRTILTGALAAAASSTFAQTTSERSDAPVVIGILEDMSGPYSAFAGPGSVIAAEMAIADFGGHVLGRPIKLLSADHQQKPEVASTKAREWIDTEHVVMITGMASSAVALAVQDLASSRKIITMNAGAGTTILTGEKCTRYGIQYPLDSYAISVPTTRALLRAGKKKWFFIAANYTFGKDLVRINSKVIDDLGGRVVGTVYHPLGAPDFSSYLLQAQGSGADVVALANAGADTDNVIKQAHEFRLTANNVTLAAYALFNVDIVGVGLDVAQGLRYAQPFYWDANGTSRAFSGRFYKRHKAMPTSDQAGAYSAVLAYLNAVKMTGTLNGDKVRSELSSGTINDPLFGPGVIRDDGLFVHNVYALEVKKPTESMSKWDVAKIVDKVDAEHAFMSLKEHGCPLIKNG